MALTSPATQAASGLATAAAFRICVAQQGSEGTSNQRMLSLMPRSSLAALKSPQPLAAPLY